MVKSQKYRKPLVWHIRVPRAHVLDCSFTSSEHPGSGSGQPACAGPVRTTAGAPKAQGTAGHPLTKITADPRLAEPCWHKQIMTVWFNNAVKLTLRPGGVTYRPVDTVPPKVEALCVIELIAYDGEDGKFSLPGWFFPTSRAPCSINITALRLKSAFPLLSIMFMLQFWFPAELSLIYWIIKRILGWGDRFSSITVVPLPPGRSQVMKNDRGEVVQPGCRQPG